MAGNTADPENDDEAYLQARCTAELKQNARVAAAQRGISISEYMRQLIREDTGMDEIDD